MIEAPWPTERDIHQLVSERSAPCISLFMPIARGAEAPKNTIRLKNLVRRADDVLTTRGVAPDERNRLLAPITALLDDEHFWACDEEGLAIFCSPTFNAAHRLPFVVTSHCVVDDRFCIKPLFAVASASARFYIVALQLGHVRLFEANRTTVREVDIEGIVPQSIDQAVSTQGDKQQQFHTVNQGRAVDPIYHGQGAGEDTQDAKTHRFFRMVADALSEVVVAGAPVVLIGPEHLVPIFRNASRKLDLVEGTVTKNPESLDHPTMLELAWPMVVSRVLADCMAATRRAHELEGTALVSHDIEEVVVAASDGRLDTLFIPRDKALWGRFDPQRRHVDTFEQRSADAADLYDVAARHAFLTGTNVYLLDHHLLPRGADVTAIFRYKARARVTA